MKLKHASSSESAAAFRESYEKRMRAKPADKAPAPKAEVREPARVAVQTRLAIFLPVELHEELLAHCAEFRLTPTKWVRRMLEQSKLSKGGT